MPVRTFTFSMSRCRSPPRTLQRRINAARAHVLRASLPRGPSPVKEPRKLNWEAQVFHGAVRRLRVQLVASVERANEHNFCCPRCAVNVWADGGDQASELAMCRARISTRSADDVLHLSWICRPRERPQDVDVDDWCLLPETSEMEAEESGTGTCDQGKRTLAQGVMGLSAAIGKKLGARAMELNPDDNGSGKLVRFYENSGFHTVPRVCKFSDPLMRAPIDVIANLAPPMWLELVVPSTFAGQQWLWDWEVVQRDSM